MTKKDSSKAKRPKKAADAPCRVSRKRGVVASPAVMTGSLPPTMGALDLHLFAEGKHEHIYEKLGAHVVTHNGVKGVSFAVWAPSAQRVSVVGDFNGWDGSRNSMRRLDDSGVWEIFIPGLATGELYKYEIQSPGLPVFLKADPYASYAEEPPNTSSVVYESKYRFRDGTWMEKRTHVEFLPLKEFPYGPSWGYQVSNYYAPSARYGTPDDLRYLIDYLHRKSIGVIMDWVPAHFPKDAFTLGRFDGSALYEHLDPRMGEHPDWGTYIFNYGRSEVRNFLIANALYWFREFHIDGLRVDAVASMLYLDYSRNEGEWVPNQFGGRENLEALAFLKELNEVTHRECPGTIMIAEESTAWPMVSHPTYTGGLGFDFKWNMGWMHDTLKYFQTDPLFRAGNHNALTFGLIYAWTENFILPLSHDEVVHMKGSLLNKMPGNVQQKFANLRALYAYMWAHPGKKLLFMGGEFGQWREWTETESLDWHLIEDPRHAGVQSLLRDLNRIYRKQECLWEADGEPAGFAWIDVDNAMQNVIAFRRISPSTGAEIICVYNFSAVTIEDYRLGLPRAGKYKQLLNTDAESYGGSSNGPVKRITAEGSSRHGLEYSAVIALPPLAGLWFEMPVKLDEQ